MVTKDALELVTAREVCKVVHVASLHDFVIKVVNCIVVVDVPELSVKPVVKSVLTTAEESGQYVVYTVEIPDSTAVIVVTPVVLVTASQLPFVHVTVTRTVELTKGVDSKVTDGDNTVLDSCVGSTLKEDEGTSWELERILALLVNLAWLDNGQ